MSQPSPQSKTELRRSFRQRLAAVDASTRAVAAAALADRVLSMPELETAQHVFCCLSFGVEVDTWPLVGRLVDSGRRVYVPRAELETRRLFVHRYPCQLERLPFGLDQPTRGAAELAAEAIDETLDVALVAGLAFDRRGFRLGHGGGFFDRFLAGRPFPAVGLAYDLQIVERLPTEAHDLPMRAVATEHRVVRSG